MTNNDKCNELFTSFQEQCKAGEWTKASGTLRLMADVLYTSKNYEDELRCLILSFYIDMSGCQRQAFVNEETVAAMREAYALSGIDKARMDELYYESIKEVSFPRHSFTPIGCLRVLTYCILGKNRKADEIISYLQK